MFIDISEDYKPCVGDVLQSATGITWRIIRIAPEGRFDVERVRGKNIVTNVYGYLFTKVQIQHSQII